MMTLDLEIGVPVDSSIQLLTLTLNPGCTVLRNYIVIRVTDKRGFANRLIMTKPNQSFHGWLHCSGKGIDSRPSGIVQGSSKCSVQQ